MLRARVPWACLSMGACARFCKRACVCESAVVPACVILFSSVWLCVCALGRVFSLVTAQGRGTCFLTVYAFACCCIFTRRGDAWLSSGLRKRPVRGSVGRAPQVCVGRALLSCTYQCEHARQYTCIIARANIMRVTVLEECVAFCACMLQFHLPASLSPWLLHDGRNTEKTFSLSSCQRIFECIPQNTEYHVMYASYYGRTTVSQQ